MSVNSKPRGDRSRPPRTLGLGLIVVAAVTLAGCTAAPSPRAATASPSGSKSYASRQPVGATAPVAATGPAVLATTPVTGASAVNPAAPVSVSVRSGRLSSVVLTNPDGKQVLGTLAPDRTSWRAAEPLGYGRSYQVTARAIGTDGTPTTRTASFSTLAPGNQTLPYLQILGGASLTTGASYGVGIVPVVHFDEPVTDRAAAQRALSITTTPKVPGAWYWVDSQNVHYRPQNFWPAGTRVSIAANVYGVRVGPGLYGQADVSGSFTIGRKQVTIASDSVPAVNKVNVYDAAGHVLRSMNTSMGTHGGVTVNGNYINFYTPGGTYTVLAHENPARMCSASYGLPANAPGGYACEPIYNSTKISIDGIYLHELDTTVWNQDNGEDVSHGCLNLNQDNAIWFFQHSLAGDPVIIRPTSGAPGLTLSEGGDWSVPWSQWLTGGPAE